MRVLENRMITEKAYSLRNSVMELIAFYAQNDWIEISIQSQKMGVRNFFSRCAQIDWNEISIQSKTKKCV